MQRARIVRWDDDGRRVEWRVTSPRPTLVGRPDKGSRPDVDLSPDRTVSRRHARIAWDAGSWWLEDCASAGGTRVDGSRIDGRVRLEPAAMLGIGKSEMLFLPEDWGVVRTPALEIAFRFVPALNPLTARPTAPIVDRVRVANRSDATTPATTVRFAVGPQRIAVPLPALAAGAGAVVDAPSAGVESPGFLAPSGRTRHAIELVVGGSEYADPGAGCTFETRDTWLWAPSRRVELAAFVTSEHPAVGRIVNRATAGLAVDADPETVVRAVYEWLAEGWHIDYRLEAASHAPGGQRVRLAAQVLDDEQAGRGVGTCLDLAVLIAGCLEAAHLRPLVAVVQTAAGRHALVGCWPDRGRRLQSVRTDVEAWDEICWIDPNGCTRDARERCDWDGARARARSWLAEVEHAFAVDVAAARAEGIVPLHAETQVVRGGEAEAVLERAAELARGHRCALGTVPVLVALLEIDGGELRRIVRALGASNAALRLTEGLRSGGVAGQATTNYRRLLARADELARFDDGLLLPEHLEQAVLEVPSRALERAFEWLGPNRAAVRSTYLRRYTARETDESEFDPTAD